MRCRSSKAGAITKRVVGSTVPVLHGETWALRILVSYFLYDNRFRLSLLDSPVILLLLFLLAERIQITSVLTSLFNLGGSLYRGELCPEREGGGHVPCVPD